MQANDDKTNNMECFWQQTLVGPRVDYRELVGCVKNYHDILIKPDAVDDEDDDKNCVENRKSR